MKTSNKVLQWLILGAALAAPAARATDLVVDGNTVVTGKIGVGMATNAVLAAALNVENGNLVMGTGTTVPTNPMFSFKNNQWAGAGWQMIYMYQHDEIMVFPMVQNHSAWPDFTLYLRDTGRVSLGARSQGRLSVNQRPEDNCALSLDSKWASVPPTMGLYLNQQIAASERLATTSLNQLQFNISPIPGQAPVAALEIHPSTNVLIGGGIVPAAKLHVLGNIIAADPTAPTHVVTRQWAETLVQASLSHLEPQGDISMGEFTAEP